MYTFGTRAYAHKVAQIIDPHDKMFKGRILARDDGGELECNSDIVNITKKILTRF